MKRVHTFLFICAFSAGFMYTSHIIPEKGEVNRDPDIKNFHTSMYFFNNSDFFTQSVESFSKKEPLSPSPRIFIVNQHILGAHVIARQFALSANENIKTVILITQNNWEAGSAPIITSRYGWKTPLGTILPNNSITDSLIERGLAKDEENIFLHEHGVTGIVPYIAHSFPNAKIVPIVIRDGTSNENVDALVESLVHSNPSETVFVGSIDMSHYLPKYIADVHDRLVVESVQSFDYDTLPRLDIDTVPTLRAVLKIAEHFEQNQFVLTDSINSADIVGDPEIMETTGYISGYFQEGQIQKSDKLHLLFVGDIMLDRGVAEHARKHGLDSLFGKVERLFLSTHAVIGNLEGTITNNESVSQKDNSILRFTFDPKFAEVLSNLNFSAVSLANNHSFDFGRDGYDQTKQYLNNSDLLYFGTPTNSENLSTRISINDREVCLVGYHDLFTRKPEPVVQEIQTIRDDCSGVVVLPHWGVEYVDTPNARQRMLAHQFIDAGADMVIGTHPHVVQTVEIYNNKPIFYSLGNFMFDQYFSFETLHGLAVHLEWGEENMQFTLVPVSITGTEAKIAEPKERNIILSTLVDTKLPDDIITSILKNKTFTLWN